MFWTDSHQNAVLSATAHHHEWSGMGSLSIKTFRGGHALYRTHGGLHRVDEHHYLVLNDEQTYHIVIDSPTPVQSFCIFFDRAFFADVYRSLALSDAALLDQPTSTDIKPPEFVERLHHHDDVITPALSAMQHAHSSSSTIERLDHLLRSLSQALLYQHQSHLIEASSIRARRAATREELYRRLYLARDFILACLDQPLTLDDMARTACLSPNHLMRTFKQLFGQSPYQFLMQQRLLRAQEYLRYSGKSVTEICLSLGFKSLGSFSWLFTRATGQSPQAYRRRHQGLTN